MDAEPSRPAPTLIGVGVGPGDPELITVKATRVLERADLILVPAADTTESDIGRAEAIVSEACASARPRIRRVQFSMASRQGVDSRRRTAWRQAADEVVQAFNDGARIVAFATVGDPSVYSTFSYLADHVRDTVPDCDVAVVPGITAMQALAATSVTPLVEGREVLALVPITSGMETLNRALDCADTVVAYKAGRQLGEVTTLLRKRGRDAGTLLGVNIGLPHETIGPLPENETATTPYFSTLLIPPSRSETGGRL